MEHYIDPFKDQKNQVTTAIEKAILQAEVMQSIFPSKITDALLKELSIIKSLYPPNFRQFIISQAIEDNRFKPGDLCLYLDEKGYWQITTEYKKIEPPANAKKKWYQF